MKKEIHCCEASFGTGAHQVDTERKVVKNVSLMGLVSRNGYRYDRAAVQQSMTLFEGQAVYADHRARSKGISENHSVRKYIGVVRGVHFDESTSRLRASELHVLNEEFWPLVSSVAQSAPNHFGMSPDLLAFMEQGVVTEIRKVSSVDLVTSPATTDGLFEETQQKESSMSVELAAATLTQLRETRRDLFSEARSDLEAKVTALTEDNKKLTSTNEQLTKELDELKSSLAHKERETKLLQQVEEAGREVSAVQLKALMKLDEADIEEYIDGLPECEASPRAERKREEKQPVRKAPPKEKRESVGAGVLNDDNLRRVMA